MWLTNSTNNDIIVIVDELKVKIAFTSYNKKYEKDRCLQLWLQN